MMYSTIERYSTSVSHIMMVALLAAALVAGCAGSNSTARTEQPGGKVALASDTIDPALEALDPRFNVVEAGGKLMLSMEVHATGASGSPRMRALRSIRSVTFRIYSPEGAMLEELTTEEVTTSGVMNAGTNESSITGSAGVSWEGTAQPGAYALMIVRSASGIASRQVTLPATTAKAPAGKSMEMGLEIEERGHGVEFVLRARRVAPGIEGEYLPSGEQFRIEIQNDRGETIWSSAHERMYTQAIGPVEPDQVGEERIFKVFWDGRSDLTHSALSAGRYRVVARIPAKPQPYMLREELNWSGK